MRIPTNLGHPCLLQVPVFLKDQLQYRRLRLLTERHREWCPESQQGELWNPLLSPFQVSIWNRQLFPSRRCPWFRIFNGANFLSDCNRTQRGRETWNEKNLSRVLDGATRMALMRALKWAPTWYVSAEVWDPFNGQPLDQVWMWYESWSLSWDISSGGSF